MNNELKCYLSFRVNIPNHILLLIERYLWQIKLSDSFEPLNEMKNMVLYSLARIADRKAGRPFQYRHKYGKNCLYNKTLCTCFGWRIFNRSFYIEEPMGIHHGALVFSK